MNARTQGYLVAAVGAVAAGHAVSGAYLDYVKEPMRLPLLTAGTIMVVLGTVTLARTVLMDRHDEAGLMEQLGSGHEHAAGGPSVAWLLVLPVLAAVLVDPPALGADAARRDSASSLPAPPSEPRFGPLPPPRDGAVDLLGGEFISRSYFDEEESLAGVPVRLTGFVVRDPDIPDGYLLTRFVMACCAGDALPLQVTVRGLDGPAPPDDTWLEVVGEWIPPADASADGAERGAAVTMVSQTEIPVPAQPYE